MDASANKTVCSRCITVNEFKFFDEYKKFCIQKSPHPVLQNVDFF